MTTRAIDFSVSKHLQPSDSGDKIIGQKYSIVIQCEGHVFYEMTRFGTDEQIADELEKVSKAIKNAEISVKM